MGRARGQLTAVAAPPRGRSRSQAATWRPREIAEVAEGNLWRILDTYYSWGGRNTWQGSSESASLLLDSIRATDMPACWAIDTVLADAATTMVSAKLVDALTEYLRARLHKDLPMVLAAGLLEGEHAEALRSQQPCEDDALAWAVVRAADLLRESKRLEELAANANAECALAARELSQMCRRVAANDLENPPVECGPAAFTLALAHAFRDEDERFKIYEGEIIQKHRQLLAAASGRVVDAPVVVVDFALIRAMRGDQAIREGAGGAGGPVGDSRACAWLDHDNLVKYVFTENDYSILVHELVHSLQYPDDESLKAHVARWDEMPEVEATLLRYLLEGATESYTREVMRGEGEHGRGAYPECQDFLHALAREAANGDSKKEKQFIADLALAKHSNMVEMAAVALYGDGSPRSLRALTEASSAYHTWIENERDQEYEKLEKELPTGEKLEYPQSCVEHARVFLQPSRAGAGAGTT